MWLLLFSLVLALPASASALPRISTVNESISITVDAGKDVVVGIVSTSNSSVLQSVELLSTFLSISGRLGVLDSLVATQTSAQMSTSSELAQLSLAISANSNSIVTLSASASSANQAQISAQQSSTQYVLGALASTTVFTNFISNSTRSSSIVADASVQALYSSRIANVSAQLTSAAVVQANTTGLINGLQTQLSSATVSLANQTQSTAVVQQQQTSVLAVNVSQALAAQGVALSQNLSSFTTTSLTSLNSSILSSQSAALALLSSSVVATASNLSATLSSSLLNTSSQLSSAIAVLSLNLASTNTSMQGSTALLSSALSSFAAQSSNALRDQQQNASAAQSQLLVAFSAQVAVLNGTIGVLTTQLSQQAVAFSAALANATQALSLSLASVTATVNVSVFQAANRYRGCSFFRLSNFSVGNTPASGVYTLPSGARVYCDFTPSVGSGWTLLATFEQPPNKGNSDIPMAMYDSYFRSTPNWIQGNSEARPLSPEPLNDGAFHFRSVNWDSFLAIGRQYQLRQRFFKGVGASKRLVFDVAYTFTYSGYTVQDMSTVGSNRIWPLTNRVVLQDTTGITWDTPTEQVQFWLPFSQNITGAFYTACNGFDFSVNSCFFGDTSVFRHFGNAGISGSTADRTDPAAAWAPLTTLQFNDHDIVYVNQNFDIYGFTKGAGGPIFLSYYVSEMP